MEGTTLCAEDRPGAISIIAMAEEGSLLYAPDVYMKKIAIGPGYSLDTIDLDADPEENILSLAKAKGVVPSELRVLILNRPRHKDLIERIRKLGARIRLISDGDVAGVVSTTYSDSNDGCDLYLGVGGAPEGVLAAAILKCIGGQIQGRLILDTEEKQKRALSMGVTDVYRKYFLNDLASGDVAVSATGVTSSSYLSGVKFKKDIIETETIIYRSVTGTVRRIKAEHREFSKFYPSLVKM